MLSYPSKYQNDGSIIKSSDLMIFLQIPAYDRPSSTVLSYATSNENDNDLFIGKGYYYVSLL